jgi:phosphate transport system permease protein
MSYLKACSFKSRPASLPFYYGAMSIVISASAAIACFISLFIMPVTQQMLIIMGSTSVAGLITWYFLSPQLSSQKFVEKAVYLLLRLASFLSIFITFSIVFILLFETARFFGFVSASSFLLGREWDPQITFDTKSSSHDYGLYGALPLFSGTLLIMLIAMIIAVPIGLFIAIYTQEYAKVRTRNIIRPAIEILAGIPSIVYGFFALVAVMPLLQSLGERIGVEISPQSALGVGIVMGLMIIPYISSLSDEALGSVSKALREGSLALGATPSETIKKIVIPAALPGIITAILLAVSRAIGETMLVVMAAGLTAHLTFHPLASVTTVTVQIVSLLTGDQEFNSPKTLSAFALGMSLFLMTLFLNIVSFYMARRYREKYDT